MNTSKEKNGKTVSMQSQFSILLIKSEFLFIPEA